MVIISILIIPSTMIMIIMLMISRARRLRSLRRMCVLWVMHNTVNIVRGIRIVTIIAFRISIMSIRTLHCVLIGRLLLWFVQTTIPTIVLHARLVVTLSIRNILNIPIIAVIMFSCFY